MTTVLDDVLDLSGDMTAGVYSLTAEALAVLFYMWNYMDRTSTWRKSLGEEITPEESDIIDALIGDTMRQIMTPMVGQITAFITLEPPPNVLPCDGTTYLREDYPMLYDVIDAEFILDADTFYVPDLSDQTIIGASDTFPFNATGGAIEQGLTTAQLPAHNHTDAGHAHSEITAVPSSVLPGEIPVPIPTAVPGIGSTGTGFASIGNTGDGEPHNNMQPYRALRYGVFAA
jgi:microcystin-dependent protein